MTAARDLFGRNCLLQFEALGRLREFGERIPGIIVGVFLNPYEIIKISGRRGWKLKLKDVAPGDCLTSLICPPLPLSFFASRATFLRPCGDARTSTQMMPSHCWKSTDS